MKRALVVAAALIVVLSSGSPASAKRPEPESPPTLELELTCHMEPGGEIPFAHIDQTSTWTGLGNGRYSLEVILSSSGHGHVIVRTPNGSDFSHMDNGAAAGETYVGFARIDSKGGKTVATATAEVTC